MSNVISLDEFRIKKQGKTHKSWSPKLTEAEKEKIRKPLQDFADRNRAELAKQNQRKLEEILENNTWW